MARAGEEGKVTERKAHDPQDTVELALLQEILETVARYPRVPGERVAMMLLAAAMFDRRKLVTHG